MLFLVLCGGLFSFLGEDTGDDILLGGDSMASNSVSSIPGGMGSFVTLLGLVLIELVSIGSGCASLGRDSTEILDVSLLFEPKAGSLFFGSTFMGNVSGMGISSISIGTAVVVDDV